MNFVKRSFVIIVISSFCLTGVLYSQIGSKLYEKSSINQSFSNDEVIAIKPKTTIKPGECTKIGGIEMVFIPGSDKIEEFYMSKYEITQNQYKVVTGVNPSKDKGANMPVTHVSWYDAVEFCNKLSKKVGLDPYYSIDKENIDDQNEDPDDAFKWTVSLNEKANGFRLPNSEEWEYAYHAGTTTTFYWGESKDYAVVNKYAWYERNTINKKNSRIKNVGLKRPNPWNLYDMAGNVEEFCFDRYPDYEGALAYRGARVAEGGGWVSHVSSLCPSRKYNFVFPSESNYAYGIRIIKSL